MAGQCAALQGQAPLTPVKDITRPLRTSPKTVPLNHSPKRAYTTNPRAFSRGTATIILFSKFQLTFRRVFQLYTPSAVHSIEREADKTIISSFRATLILLSGLSSRDPYAFDHRVPLTKTVLTRFRRCTKNPLEHIKCRATMLRTTPGSQHLPILPRKQSASN